MLEDGWLRAQKKACAKRAKTSGPPAMSPFLDPSFGECCDEVGVLADAALEVLAVSPAEVRHHLFERKK
jgi:hypothetical protein